MRAVLAGMLWLLLAGLAQAGGKPEPLAYDPALHQSGVITVRFTRDSGLRVNDQQKLISTGGVKSARLKALRQPGQARWNRFVSMPMDRMDELHARAMRRSPAKAATLVNLNRYALAWLPPMEEKRQQQATADLLQQLRALPEVEAAWPMPRPVAPPVPPDYTTANDDNFRSDYSRSVYQQYLDNAPQGMGFAQVNASGEEGRGSGGGICDVEYNFLDTHADLPTISDLSEDISLSRDPDHGTAVLSILGALDNGFGIRGLVPDSELYFARPYLRASNQATYNVAEGISRCMDAMNVGDVILLEQQMSGPNRPANPEDNDQNGLVPVEWFEPTYDAIVLAVTAGYVVVEAAGNGAEDLDDSSYTTGNGGHYPFNGSKDSGAILVGAASPGIRPGSAARDPLGFTNHGSRVDVFAWGQDVVAAGYGWLWNSDGEGYEYTLFSGTSSASPLITAAAMIAQRFFILANGAPATSEEIRTLLRDNGITSLGPEQIGVIPDMALVVSAIAGNTAVPQLLVDTPSGVYLLPRQVGVSVPGASLNDVVRYTLDGSEPDFESSYQFSPVSNSQLTVFTSSTLKIKAWRYDPTARLWQAGQTLTFQYTNSADQVVDPVISPASGDFAGNTVVTITSATPGATIKYRTDGKTIGFFRPGTTYTGPITLGEGTYRIVARAYKEGLNSSKQVKSDYITVTPLQLPQPSIYPGSGPYTESVTAYVGSTVVGATIRCTTDGSEPVAQSIEYFAPVSLTTTTTLKCKTFLAGYTPSATASASYTINPVNAPSLFPASGATGTGSLQISMVGVGGPIYYTIDGADPTRYDSLYNGPITLGVGIHQVRARSITPEGLKSAVVSADYRVYSTAAGVATPVVTPFSTQTFADPFQVSMHTDTEGATILYMYSTDGSTWPTNEQPTLGAANTSQYNGIPLNITANGDYRFRVRAYKNGIYSATVETGQLSKVSPLGTTALPVFDPPPGVYHNPVSLSMTAGTSEVVLYTTNGSDPVTNPPAVFPSQQYTAPVTLNTSATVKATAYRIFFGNGGTSVGEYELRCAQPALQIIGQGSGYAEIGLSTQTANATIRYTLDGSQPGPGSTLYTGPITLSSGIHDLRAYCTRSGFLDSTESTHGLMVPAPYSTPVFSLQPVNTQALFGERVVLAALATGSPEPQLQWYFNGQPLAGQNEPELVIDAFSAAHVGSYHVQASNLAGEASSVSVTLVQDTETIFRTGFESGSAGKHAGPDKGRDHKQDALVDCATPACELRAGGKGKPGGGPGVGGPGGAVPIPALLPAGVWAMLLLFGMAAWRVLRR